MEQKGCLIQVFVNESKLCFQHKAGLNWSAPMVLDKEDISEYAVAIAPGDYLPVVFCKEPALKGESSCLISGKELFLVGGERLAKLSGTVGMTKAKNFQPASIRHLTE